MAVVYTTESVSVVPTIRDVQEGQGFLLVFDLVRDGTVVVRHIQQFFLATKTNVEMWDELRPALREIIEDDYRQLGQATLANRAAAIQALLDGKDWTLP